MLFLGVLKKKQEHFHAYSDAKVQGITKNRATILVMKEVDVTSRFSRTQTMVFLFPEPWSGFEIAFTKTEPFK